MPIRCVNTRVDLARIGYAFGDARVHAHSPTRVSLDDHIARYRRYALSSVASVTLSYQE